MAEDNVSLYYLYGIVEGNYSEKINKIQEGGISAIYELVSIEEFGEDVLTSNLKNVEWVTKKVTHHQEVLNRYTSEAIIPLKFGSLFESEKGVRAMLTEKATHFKGLLKKIENKEEWGIKLFYDSGELATWMHSNIEEIKDKNKEMAAATPGKAFLLKKKTEELIKAYSKIQINDERQRVFDTLKSANAEIKQNPELSPGLSTKNKVNILNLAVLISNQEAQHILEASMEIMKDQVKKGFTLDITGPWPPYNFVSP